MTKQKYTARMAYFYSVNDLSHKVRSQQKIQYLCPDPSSVHYYPQLESCPTRRWHADSG